MNQKIKSAIKKNSLLNKLARKVEKLKVKARPAISGKNNIVINKGVLFDVKYDILGNDNRVEIKQGAVLSNILIYIRGDRHQLTIGNDCRIKGGSIWFEDNDCRVEIGQKTTIESAHLAVTEPGRKIMIGEDCMFSNAIELRTGDSHSIIDISTGKRINPAQDIIIGNHVWVGAHSIILKGVHIGDNSIIGTNSLVTKDVPAHSISAGIPAKILRDNIDWRRERIYDK
ncbi:MAG TPA: acyltransferase [Chitinophagaceae bacterium]